MKNILSLVVFLIAVAVGYVAATWHSDRIATAKLVADNHDLKYWGYVWRSNREVEVFQDTGTIQCETAYIVNADNGHRRLDTDVTNHLIELGRHPAYLAPIVPTKRPRSELVLKSATYVVCFAGELLANGPGILSGHDATVLDDRRLVYVWTDYNGNVIEYVGNSAGTGKIVTKPILKADFNVEYELIGATPDHRLILDGWMDSGPIWAVDIVSVSPEASKVNPIHYHVKFPARTSLRPPTAFMSGGSYFTGRPFSPFVSPDGKHIAWPLAYSPPSDSRPPALRRLMSALHIHRPQPTACLWVSNLDGSDMRPVGFWGDGGHPNEIDQFRWLPDSKHISFRRSNGKLYVADVSGLLN